MKQGFYWLLLVGFLTALPASSQAQAQDANGTGASLRVSTLGLGAELSHGFGAHIAGRLGFNAYSFHRDGTYKEVAYDGHLKLSTVTALADLYPSASSTFHLTAGLAINNNRLDGTGKPSGNGTYTINGTTYTAAQVGTLSADARFRRLSPYFGFGFGRPAGGRSPLQILFDVGVLLQDKPSLSLSATGAIASPALAGDVAAQRARTQSDLNKFNVYPVVSVGLSYRL